MSKTHSHYLSVFFLFALVQNILIAQDIFLDIPKKNTFIEANISINSARNLSELNSNFNFFIADTVNYNLFSRDAFELQLKYTHHFAEQFSWYGGIYLGHIRTDENISLRDSILMFGTGTSFSNSPSEFFSSQKRAIYYTSLSGGIRASGAIFKNDRVYFNIGGKLTIYPKQDLSLSTTRFSNIRGEEFTHNSSSDLDENTIINGSIEIDFSYHLITKSEKYRFIIGILADRSEREIFNIKNEIVLLNNTHSYEHVFTGLHIGAYLGFAYVLNEKERSIP